MALAQVGKGGVALAALMSLTMTSPLFSGDVEGTSLKTARKAAGRDAKTPEGKAWERQHAVWLGPAITPTSQECGRRAAEGMRKLFTVYLRLSKAGAVSEALVSPETPYSMCFRDGVRTLTYPEVPRDGYWLEIRMHPSPPE